MVFWTNRRTPPPSRDLVQKKTEFFFQCLFCILDHSEQFIFSWKFTIFWVFLGWDRGTPPPSLGNWPNFFRFFLPSLAVIFLGGPITLWIDEILPPHLCSVCFITFMDSSKANLVLEKFDKKLGFGQPPPPVWSKRPNFSVFFFFMAPLRVVVPLLDRPPMVWKPSAMASLRVSKRRANKVTSPPLLCTDPLPRLLVLKPVQVVTIIYY